MSLELGEEHASNNKRGIWRRYLKGTIQLKAYIRVIDGVSSSVFTM
jgi:hypothetical protein